MSCHGNSGHGIICRGDSCLDVETCDIAFYFFKDLLSSQIIINHWFIVYYFPEYLIFKHDNPQSLISNKLVLNIVGKNQGVDLVSLSSNGNDIATHLLSSGLVEFEKQKNRNRYGTLVSCCSHICHK